MRDSRLFSLQNNKLKLLALLTFIGAGFSSLDSFPQIELGRKAFAQTVTRKKTTAKKKKAQSAKKTDEQALDEDPLFLKEAEKAREFLPDLYRCPECGYEQDEPGTCPDHNTLELVKVLSRGRDPLEPAELDGNEDIIVDIPLKDLQFKKENVIQTASESVPTEK
ncbi:MAG: hypothetical protein PHD82_16415 [Candidatus Riflebacteria bacterium]|nr:hypothetical protein [Candidatus Riflebacteria bacterium]